MIDDRTVLVLGAGASAHAGYYVGQSFKAAICNLAGDKGFLQEAHNLGFDKVEQFLERFKFSGIKSPDRFLEDSRMEQYRAVGKFCIAHVLINLESDDRLFPAGDAGWYETLYDRLGIETDSHPDNQLAIITYNYDRSLECAIWKITAALNSGDESRITELWGRRPEVIHIHGILDLFDPLHEAHRPYERTRDPQRVNSAASQIRIVSEADLNTKPFIRARELLRKANRIIFLGFGFNKTNIDRLKVFDEPEQREKIQGTIYQIVARDRKHIFEEVFGVGLNISKLVNQRIDEYVYDNL